MDERSLKKYCRRAASYLECGRAQRETFRNFIRASAVDMTLTCAPDGTLS